MGAIFKPAKNLSKSGVILAAPGFFQGFLLGLDGTNNATVTIYDHASAASGEELVPTNTYSASKLGLNGAALPYPKQCKNGCYAEITCGGAVELEPLVPIRGTNF